MRVLVIAHGFPPSAEAGAEIYAEAHASVLRQSFGEDVVVLAREADPNRADGEVRSEHRGGLSITWLNNTYRNTRCFEVSYRNASIAKAVARVIDEHRPEVAHIHHLTNLSTMIVDELAMRRIPSIVTLHDYWLMCHRGQLLDTAFKPCNGPDPASCGRCLGPAASAGALTFAAARAARVLVRSSALPRPLRTAADLFAGTAASSGAATQEAVKRLGHMRDVCEKVSHFIAPSQYLRDRFVEFGIPSTKITLSPYGFDHAPFRKLTRTSSDRLRIGFFGSLMVSKAPHVLLDAAGRLPPGRMSIDLFGAHTAYHGDDSYRAHLTSHFPQAGVRFHGAIPHDGVAAAFASIDLLAVPSIWPENSPLVIQEAFLAGVPVVASRIGGIPEAVAEGVNGLLVRPDDPDDLARALRRFLDEPGLLDALRRGIPRVRSIRDDAEAVRALYRESIAVSSLGVRKSLPVSNRRRPRVAAVVLNYRTPDDTVLTVKSLLALRRPPDELIVVNNDVANGTTQRLASISPHISVLHTGRNLGYAGGMNVGIQHALAHDADLVALVNSDVSIPPDCLERLEECLAAMPDAGIAGPVVLSRSAPDRIASLGMSYSPLTGRMRHHGFGERLEDRATPLHSIVDGVSGCLMLVTRRVFETVGLLDDDYFFSFEDLDFCLRAREKGFVTVLAGSAIAHHEGGRSIGATSPSRLYFAARNHLRLAGRRNAASGRVEVIARTVSIVTLNLAHAIRSRGAWLPVRLSAVTRGSLDYFAGRSGRGTFAE
jgi:GT2 family glycosyltransferase/glycosyltransferase involved in cell wall biosynthesis